MKLKIKWFICFVFLSLIGFSQDPATKKPIYKIPASEVKPSTTCAEAKRVTPDKKAIQSCEIDKAQKEATVTILSSDGTPSKEKFEIKSENK